MACDSFLRGCAALLSVVGLLAAGVVATLAVQAELGTGEDDVLLEASLLFGVGIILVCYDLRHYGPTVALHSGTLAAACAWFLIVPLGLACLKLERVVPLAGFAALSGAVLVSTIAALPDVGWIVGPLAAGLIMYASTKVAAEEAHERHPVVSLAVDQAGTVLVFAALYFAIRRVLNLSRIHHWPDAEEMDPASAEFQERRAYFKSACYAWAHKYPFRLEIVRIYKMRRASYRPVWANPRHLFHGTPWEAAYAIVADGFRLPKNPGMFGKGIYFADCPLKSWQYTRSLCEQLMCCRRGGLILMCLVDLGEQRQEKAANLGLAGYDRNSWWAWLTLGSGAYDSVVGLTDTEGGALRVPEYVVYNPNNVRVEYIFEVVKRAPGPNGE